MGIDPKPRACLVDATTGTGTEKGPARRVLEKRLDAVIETVQYKEAGAGARDAFLDGADMHGYVLGEDLPERWQCEICGAYYELDSLAIATTGAMRGHPVCAGDGLFVSDCPAYGFDFIRPALPDEFPEDGTNDSW